MLITNSELKKHDIDLSDIENDFFNLGHEVEEITSFENDKLVIGKIIKIEKHENADTLNVCSVDIKEEVLQIVCGAPNVVLGGYVVVALVGCKLGDFKIKKSKIRGVESFGMLCSLEEIGFSKDVLTSDDLEGILILKNDYELNSNALKVLNLDDKIYDLGLTANRGDCLSYDGILRDLYAFNSKKYSLDEAEVEADNSNDYQVFNSCGSVLSSQLLTNFKVEESDLELKLFLAKHGVKSQNNIVDYATYIMYILGIPIHVYDADKIKDKLEVKILENDEKFIGLDGIEYVLKKGCQVISDSEKITAIASVLGSNETKVTDGTKNILVEIGIFDPILVRKSAQMILKKTDASIRGEKGIDPLKVMYGYEMLSKQFDCVFSEVNFSNEIEFKQKIVKLDFHDIKKILGIEIKYEVVKKILSNLNFELVDEEDEFLSYLIPSYRFDIFNDNDLIEEIIRIYGIDKIKTKESISTFINTKPIINNSCYLLNNKIEENLLDSGLNQVITYSLVSNEHVETFKNNVDNVIELELPMSSNRKFYRLSLLPSLIECAKYNADRNVDSINIFETGSIYFKRYDETVQNEVVSCLLSGIKNRTFNGATQMYNFFDLKAILEKLFSELNVSFDLEKCIDVKELNPYASANIIVQDEVVGVIGLKHLEYFKKLKNDVFIFEVNLSKIKSLKLKDIKYQKVSLNPDLQRDLTFTVKKDIDYKTVVSIFNKKKYVSDVELINIYEGENIKLGYVSYTYSIKFSTKDDNLTNEQVDKVVTQITTQAVGLGFIFKDA